MMSNRPIKLRAWDTDSRTFVPVVSVLLPESRPVVQFTGVYDANGSEIWEGDILCWRHVDEADRVYYKCFSRVVFRNGAFGTIGADESDDLDHFEDINSGDTLAGNVFVDKDLLTCNLELTW